MSIIIKRAFKLLASITSKNILLETSNISSKHLVEKGFFATFAGELHNSITNHI